METAIATNGKITFAPDQIDLMKSQIAKGASDEEFKLFLMQCQRTGLDPFVRQIFLVKRWDAKLGKEVMSVQTSVDGFRLIAERTGKYAGQVGPEWCGTDGVWTTVWLSKDYPLAARVGILRHDFKEPLYSVAKWDSYAVTFIDKKTGKQDLTPFWKRMPDLMLAKCAESLALRKAFPQDLSGLYTSEEFSVEPQEEKEIHTAVQPAKERIKPTLEALKKIVEKRKGNKPGLIEIRNHWIDSCADNDMGDDFTNSGLVMIDAVLQEAA